MAVMFADSFVGCDGPDDRFAPGSDGHWGRLALLTILYFRLWQKPLLNGKVCITVVVTDGCEPSLRML